MTTAIQQTLHPAANAFRVPQREIEAIVGGALLKTVGKVSQERALKKSKLVPKEVYLPKCRYTMYYHEREAVGSVLKKKDQPTILLFHGLTMRSEAMAPFTNSLDIPMHIRVLVPEQRGHGRDMERARSDPEYEQPTHESMLESTSEFLDEVECGSNTRAFGISLGGAVCYYVAHKRPDIIRRTVLVSPAILPCVDKDLINGLQDGTNKFCCCESREDVKLFMRDLSTGRDDTDRKKKDPIPKFFYEAIYRDLKTAAPEGHNRAMLQSLLVNAGLTHSGLQGGTDDITNPFTATTDVDQDSHRLVIWPEKDRIINCDQGKVFFGVSSTKEETWVSKSKNTKFESIPDCGHVFNADGKGIIDIIRPRVREYLLNFDANDKQSSLQE